VPSKFLDKQGNGRGEDEEGEADHSFTTRGSIFLLMLMMANKRKHVKDDDLPEESTVLMKKTTTKVD
jgi:hypothetical protein